MCISDIDVSYIFFLILVHHQFVKKKLYELLQINSKNSYHNNSYYILKISFREIQVLGKFKF
jgi:hypothetical protein